MGLTLLFFLLIYTTLQSQWFQDWAIKKITDNLSEKLNTTVKIDHISIDLLSKLDLQGFYLADLKGDTLLYAENFKVDYGLTWKTFYGQGFAIDGLLLENAKIFINRKEGEKDNSLQFVLDYFKGEEKPKSNVRGIPFDLKIKYLSFKKIRFVQDDEVIGNKTTALLDEGAITFEKLDLPDNQILIKSIELVKPDISIADKTAHPLPEKAETNETTFNVKEEKDTTKPKPLRFRLNNFSLSEGSFLYDNYRVSSAKKYEDIIDFNHLTVSNLSFKMDSLNLEKDDLKAKLKGIAFKEKSGFQLISLNAKEVHLTPKRLELNGFQILTPNSNIGDTLVFKFRNFDDFNDFENKVLLETSFNKSRLALKDLMPFDHGIATNDFFVQNANDIFNINGRIFGKLNSLKGNKLAIDTKGLSFKGNFSSKNILLKDQEVLNLNVERLLTDVNTIQLLVPGLEIPDNIRKINTLDFNGLFDGFFYNFVAKGNLKTDLGSIGVDMQLDATNGQANANYNGKLKLNDFDLATFLDNKELGKITIEADVKDGKGLRKTTANADVNATIASFPFRGYEYKNLTMKGKIDKSLFDGDFGIKDENIDFSFKGKVDFSDTIPAFNIKANVRKINLKALKLIKEDIAFAGLAEINLKGTNEDNIQGAVKLNKIDFNFPNKKNNGNDYFRIDSLVLNSEVTSYQYRKIDIKSEILNGVVEGNFDFKRLPLSIKNYIVRNHPNIGARLDFAYHPEAFGNDYVDLKVNILNSKNFTRLIDRHIDTLRNVTLKAHFNSVTDSLFFDIGAPGHIKYDNIQFNDVAITAALSEGFGEGFVGVYKTLVGKDKFGTVLIPLKFQGDALDLTINAEKLSKELHDFNIQTDFFIEKDFFQLGFKPSSFYFINEKWAIDTAKNIRFDNKNIEIPNVSFKNGSKQVLLSDVNKKGIQLLLKGFKMEDLSEVINDNRVNLAGDVLINAKIDNIFEQKGINATVSADTVRWNGRDFGVLRTDITLKDLDSPAKIYTSLTNGSEQLTVEGFYVLPGNSYVSKGVRYPENTINAFATTSNIPLIWIKYLAGEGLSDMKGTIDAKLQISGDITCPEIQGRARVRDVSFKIDYLNTTYYIKDETAIISDNVIDATGAKIQDERGNTATITGGLTHQYFNYLRLDLVIDSGNNDILAMNTTKEMNNLYYGVGVGKMRLRFSGSFERTYINIERAVTGKGTVLSIPVNSTQNADAVSFIHFKDKKITVNNTSNKEANLDGLNFEMTLNMTQDAEVRIVFDERAGDVIQGRGNGLLKFDVPISGDFRMTGDYKFSEGKYLFTIRQNFLNVDKPFTIREGGTLSWSTGDPFAAQMDLYADYKGLRTPPYNLIADVLPTNDDASAKQATNVDLAMHMTGMLLKPDIAFDIRFPTLIGNLKSYTDNKLNLLVQDQAELNRQVFGLIVLGDFLPSGNNNTSASNLVGTTLNNTLSGFISTQLSNYVNGWLRDVIKSNNVLSSVDLDINTRGGVLTPNAPTAVVSLNEVQVKPRFNLFDNRLSIDAGVVRGNDQNQNTYISGDFAVEYLLLKDGHIRVRAYNRSVQEIDGPRNRTGVGLTWRREFNKWTDLRSRKKLQ